MAGLSTVHAGAARVRGRGVLIRGAPGSGKSSLLLSLIDGDANAILVADDRVAVAARAGRLVASAPAEIAGLIEVRGVGIVRLPYAAEAAIDLVVDLVPPGDAPRLPDAPERRVTIEGVPLSRIFIHAGAPDGAARVRAALTGDIL